MKHTWPGGVKDKMCWPFFHKWGKASLTNGVSGISCEYVRYCKKCHAHQTWSSGQAKPWSVPNNEFGKKYKESYGDIVNIS